jgi:hypothetical protein
MTSAPTGRPRASCEDSDKIPEGRTSTYILHLSESSNTTKQSIKKPEYGRNLTPEDLCSDCQASAQLWG